MPILFFGLLLFFGNQASADLTAGLRFDYVKGAEQDVANRTILKSKLNFEKSFLGFYAEGFAEVESNENQKNLRRTPYRGYLQEAYLELKFASLYARVGRQALRWSESWTLPSLDIWTGRRYNRLFLDPLSEQLVHPTGVLFSYASEIFALDAVAIQQVAESTYPEPIPEQTTPNQTGYGAKAKLDLKGFSFSGLAAQIHKKNYYGISANYAFDVAVPKFEFGHIVDNDSPVQVKPTTSFATLGADLFLGNWILFPQISNFEVQSPNYTESQLGYYFSAQWKPSRHELQFQVFRNEPTEDSFMSASYGYDVADYLSALLFVQNYSGVSGLYQYYEDLTGGTVVGFRVEWTGNYVF